MNPELDRKLRSLRLSGMALPLPVRNPEAIHHHLAHADFLELLVEDELDRRRDRLFARSLKRAGLPEVKTLEERDWSFNPQLPKTLILDLATTRFVREHGGLLRLAPSDTGKTISRRPPGRQRHQGGLHGALPLGLRPGPGIWRKLRRPAPVRSWWDVSDLLSGESQQLPSEIGTPFGCSDDFVEIFADFPFSISIL